MTKTDWLVLAGFVLLAAGLGAIYRPLALIFAGLVCLYLAPSAARSKSKKQEESD